jgi:hypothetical protein
MGILSLTSNEDDAERRMVVYSSSMTSKSHCTRKIITCKILGVQYISSVETDVDPDGSLGMYSNFIPITFNCCSTNIIFLLDCCSILYSIVRF